ncbi:MAG: hypothetical protein ACI9IP_000327 [Arcticibacterium sp.]|jgi:hypothetical protein
MRFSLGFLLLLFHLSSEGQALKHSHNDYEQAKPLETALLYHFNSIESDITEFQGRLIVSHDAKNLHQKPTLEVLYLKPLSLAFQKQSSLQYFFIDVKNRQENTLDLLHELVSSYDRLFLKRGESLGQHKVQIILSGDVERMELVDSNVYPYFFVDGRLSDINQNINSAVMPIISANFQLVEPWRINQQLSPSQKERLSTFVNQIHQENKKLRFWNTRDETIFWQLLQDIGVDIIGTDHIQELNEFINSK